MRRWAFLLLLSGLAACSDGPLFEDPGPTGLVIDISAASSVVASVDVVSIRVDGPVTRSRTAAPGETITFGDLAPGSYVVSVEGRTGSVVEWYDQATVQVTAGNRSQANLSTRTFRPLGLNAPSQAAGVVRLSWAAVVNAVDYRIEWDDNSAFSSPGVLTTSSTVYDFDPPSAGSFHFRMSARSPLGGYSSQVSAGPVIVVVVPSAPAAPSVTSPTTSSLRVDWSGVSGATFYRVTRATASGGPYSQVQASVAGTTWTDTGLSAGTTYYYRIEACSSAGCSSPSSPGQGTTTVDPTPPATPGVPTVTAQSSSSLRVDWSGVSGATFYRVTRATASGGPYSQVQASVTGTTWTDAGLSAGTTYYYRIEACNSAGCSSPSNPGQGTTTVDPTPPGTPGAPTVTAQSSSSLEVTWSGVTGATFYRVTRATASGGPYSQVQASVVGTAWTDTGLNPGTTYYYRIEACNSAGCSNPSNPGQGTTTVDQTPPGTPGAPTVTAQSSSSLEVTWSGVTGATFYRVTRATASGGPYGEVQPGVVGTAWTDTGLSAGTTYYYRIEACNSAGCSSPSNPGQGTTTVDPTPPATPGAPTVTAQSSSSLEVTWSGVTGATFYRVTRATASGGPYSEVQPSVVGTTWTDTGLSAGTTYYYRIEACNSAGCSSPSNPGQGTTTVDPTPPATPGAPTVTAQSSSSLEVTWSGVTGATFYRVTRATASGGPYSEVQPSVVGTTWTDTGLNAGTTYYYRIEACNVVGCSNPSSPGQGVTVPPTPGAPDAASLSAYAMAVSWAAVPGATEYEVYRSQISSQVGSLVITSSNLSVQDYPLSPSTTYYYRVKACNPGGCSDFSPARPATTEPGPAAPDAPRVSGILGSSRQIDWKPVDLALFYWVYRATAIDGPYVEIAGANGTLTDTTFVDDGLTPGALYYYRISAGNFANPNSPFSPPGGATGVPQLTVISSVANSVTLEVSAVNDGVDGLAVTEIRYSLPGTDWESATPVDGTVVGQDQVVVTGLTPGTSYEFRAVSWRVMEDGSRQFGPVSEPVTRTTAAAVPAPGDPTRTTPPPLPSSPATAETPNRTPSGPPGPVRPR